MSATLIATAFTLNRDRPEYRAIAVTQREQPKLFQVVGDVSARVGTAPPDNVILGLAPTFFVTQTPLEVIDRELQGTTLYLSLPLLLVLARDELQAILAHELHHFRGEDAAYSARFAPTYARLRRALFEIDQAAESAAGGRYPAPYAAALNFMRLPADTALRQCLFAFASAERSIGRERELAADAGSALLYGPRPLVTALLKSTLYAPTWWAVESEHIRLLNEGHPVRNLTEMFGLGCRQAYLQLDWQSARPMFEERTTVHPVDTHPPTGARIEKLGVNMSDVNQVELGPPEASAAGIVDNYDRLAETLTADERRYLVSQNVVLLPQSRDGAVGPTEAEQAVCYKCGQEFMAGASWCPHCGAPASATS